MSRYTIDNIPEQAYGWLRTCHGTPCLTRTQLKKLGADLRSATALRRQSNGNHLYALNQFDFGAEFAEYAKRLKSERIKRRQTQHAEEQRRQAQAMEAERQRLESLEFYTGADLKALGWSTHGIRSRLGQKLFYRGDYVRALGMRREKGRIITSNVPLPPDTTFVGRQQLLKGGWKRSEINMLPSPLIQNGGRCGSAYWWPLDIAVKFRPSRLTLSTPADTCEE